MTVTIRTITADEALAFRRAARVGFSQPETVDDAEFVQLISEPFDRVRAAFDGTSIVATFRSFPTQLTVPGGAAVTAGAVTAVTCRATHRRQGLLTQMMHADLADSAARGEPVDVLIASEFPIYGRFGYGPAAASTSWELDASRARFVMPGEGTVELIDNETLRKEAPGVFERVRSARPGMITRDDVMWDMLTDLRRRPEDKPWQGFRLLCRDADGVAQGWASYTIKDEWEHRSPRGMAEVPDLLAATPAAEARLWRFLAELDWVMTVKADDRPTDEVLPWLLSDARAARETFRGDFLWVRVLDAAAAFSARIYTSAGRLVLEVVDPLGHADGRFALDASPDGATCVPTDETADITMPVATLGTVYLGGVHVTTLHAAGWLDEHTPGAVTRADPLFATTVAPWCNTWF
jgi:predicted acetyltransferase